MYNYTYAIFLEKVCNSASQTLNSRRFLSHHLLKIKFYVVNYTKNKYTFHKFYPALDPAKFSKHS